ADARAEASPPAAPDPAVRMTAGRSRPLVLTVLEPDEAMRVLAADGRGRTRAAGILIGLAVVLVLGSAAWAVVGLVAPAIVGLAPGVGGIVATALAASPEATPEIGGDPRSNGQGPGLVGTPGLAILGVATIAILAIVVTTIYVRLTAPSRNQGSGTTPADRTNRDRPPR